jgi:hypothetical protein
VDFFGFIVFGVYYVFLNLKVCGFFGQSLVVLCHYFFKCFSALSSSLLGLWFHDCYLFCYISINPEGSVYSLRSIFFLFFRCIISFFCLLFYWFLFQLSLSFFCLTHPLSVWHLFWLFFLLRSIFSYLVYIIFYILCVYNFSETICPVVSGCL